MPVSASSLATEASHRTDEGRHHRESAASVRLKAQRLRRALDADRLDEAIRVAADVAAELRSSASSELSPKAYYDVYLSVCAELRLLEMYAMESARRGAPVLKLYERVQETPMVLARLYLLITSGSVYVKSMQAPAKDVLRDLVDMCAGVQHPQRGLFLRAYLAQMMKDKLPDGFSEPVEDVADDGSTAGTVYDSIEFVIRNFTEMNRLWVRMQNDGSPREMELREKERLELRLLVGSNIATLSRLVGDNLAIYRDNVLPAILEQIVYCKDAIAQEYLADCVAQVFPDEFQLATLEAFMQMCGDLVEGVNMRTILVSIIDRLTRYAASSQEAADLARSANAFQVFRTHLPNVVKWQGASLVLTDRLRIYQSLMSFALQSEPERTDQVDDVLRFCAMDMDAFQTGDMTDTEGFAVRSTRRSAQHPAAKALSTEDEFLTVKILAMPVEAFQSVGVTLKLENYVILQGFLNYENQKSLAARLLMCNAGYEPCIYDVATLGKLFRFVAPLVKDRSFTEEDYDDGTEARDEAYEKFDVGSLTPHHEYLLNLMPVSNSTGAGREALANGDQRIRSLRRPPEEDGFEKKQELVARIVYLCDSKETQNAMVLYSALRQELIAGGERRIRITLPSLVFASLRLALKCGHSQGTAIVEKILPFAAESISFLDNGCALLALRLRLHVAGTAASFGASAGRFVYDNIAEAFVAYEQQVTSSREQNMALELIISNLGESREVLDEGSFEALSSRAVKHAGRALTRSDQCILLSRCAQLFPPELGDRALLCIQRAVKAAECCVSSAERVLLLLDVVSVGVRLQEEQICDVCVDDLLLSVLKKIREIVSSRNAKGSSLGKLVAARYQRIVNYIRARLELFETLDASEL